MKPIGTHIILDMYNIDLNKLANINSSEESEYFWDNFINSCFKEANITCLKKSWHNFDNNGAFTGIYLLAESHLSIHTWPEYNFIAVDIFTCGNSNTQLIADKLITYFESKNKNIQIIKRGENMCNCDETKI